MSLDPLADAIESNLSLLVEGKAVARTNARPGEIDWDIQTECGRVRVRFSWIVAVLYLDDVLLSSATFPYAYGNGSGGIYEVQNSVMLETVRNNPQSADLLASHRHFVYFDSHFYWHVFARDIEIDESQ